MNSQVTVSLVKSSMLELTCTKFLLLPSEGGGRRDGERREEKEREKREKRRERRVLCSCPCVCKLYLLKDHE